MGVHCVLLQTTLCLDVPKKQRTRTRPHLKLCVGTATCKSMRDAVLLVALVAVTLIRPSVSFVPAAVLRPSPESHACHEPAIRMPPLKQVLVCLCLCRRVSRRAEREHECVQRGILDGLWRSEQVHFRRAPIGLRAESSSTAGQAAVSNLNATAALGHGSPPVSEWQEEDHIAAALEALRQKRAEKQAQGETVFFDDPSSNDMDAPGPDESEKPLLLYLTGMDGLGVSGEPQFKDLSNIFQVRRLQVLAEDRCDFDQLVEFVLDFMGDWHSRTGGKTGKIVLMGESFGGLLATGVALKNQTLVQGLCLVNPATSFDRTDWPTLGPLLAALPSRVPLSETRLLDIVRSAPGADTLLGIVPLPVPDKTVGELAYAALAGGTLFARALDRGLAGALLDVASREGSQVANAFQSRRLTEKLTSLSESSVKLLESLLATLPAATVAHRLDKCLRLGCLRIEGKLPHIDVPTVVVAGQDDNILPSAEEASRLVQQLPQCTKVVLGGQGHLALGADTNMTRILIDSKVVPAVLRRDRVNDFVPPSPSEASDAVQSLQGLRQVFSPVFYSLDAKSGKVVQGLAGVPDQEDGRPLLFIGNHQTLSLDLGLLVSEVYEQKGLLMRGLAHPVLFGAGGGFGVPGAAPPPSRQGAPDPIDPAQVQQPRPAADGSGFFEKFGAVPVSGRNFAKLMRRGDAVLLFPGGVKETVPAVPEDKYQLMWPDKSEFVRLAAKYNATIVPFGAIGAAETLNVVATAQELEDLRASPVGQLLPRSPLGPRAQPARQGFGGPGGVDPERLKFPPSPLAVPAP